MSIIFILMTTVFINNYVLVNFLGLCPLMGVSRKFDSALGLGIATTFVMTLSSVISYSFNSLVLVPLEIGYLQTISFIFIIAATVQLTEIFMRKASPVLHSVLGVYLPLITTNCIVLGVALLIVKIDTNLTGSLFYGLGSGLGFTMVLLIFSNIREYLEAANTNSHFKGAPIAFITLGIMAMAFMGFNGMFK